MTRNTGETARVKATEEKQANYIGSMSEATRWKDTKEIHMIVSPFHRL